MIKGTDQIYSGFYHSLWTGKYFTGKTQNELPKSELVPITPQSGPGTPDLPPALETTNTIALFLNDPDPVVNEDQWNQGDIVTYLKLTGQSTTDDKPREMPYQCSQVIGNLVSTTPPFNLLINSFKAFIVYSVFDSFFLCTKIVLSGNVLRFA